MQLVSAEDRNGKAHMQLDKEEVILAFISKAPQEERCVKVEVSKRCNRHNIHTLPRTLEIYYTSIN